MMDERKDARTHARTDGRTDGRTWATFNALPHSTNSGGITKNVLTVDPIPMVVGVCKDIICHCMVISAPFPLIDMQHDFFQKKMF